MFTGIALKIISAFVFTLMAASIRWVGDAVPPGQVVFARSFFALIPLLIWLGWNGQLMASVRVRNISGHFLRSLLGTVSMFLNFAALARLALADATVIGYASPLIAVCLAFLLLKERVGVYRWSAVAIGLFGVFIILAPHLASGAIVAAFTGSGSDARVSQGMLLALAGACCSSCAMIQIRRLTQTESTGAIVFYFTAFSTLLALLSAPFGWRWPGLENMLVMVLTGCLGGVGQILLVQSYRTVEASLIAPFEYTTILWAVLIGWFLFGDAPNITVYVGAAVIIGSGVFVILRERQLGIERAQAREADQPPLT